MALVKTCPTCGRKNSPASPFCEECGVSLVTVAPASDADETRPGGKPPSGNGTGIVCPDCGGRNDAQADRCVYCNFRFVHGKEGAQVFCVDLCWPWGKERLENCLRIGREAPAPEDLIRKILAFGYDNVSRVHADMIRDNLGRSVSVVDLGSTNGTFVDGIKIPSNNPVVLKNGAVVRFAAGLSVVVSITDEGEQVSV